MTTWKQSGRDAVTMAALVAAAIALSLHGMSRIDDGVYQWWDMYFQADGLRVLSNVSDRWSTFQERTVVHPAFSILFYPLVKAMTATGLSVLDAMRLLTLAAAGGTVCLLYKTFAAVGLTYPARVLSCLIFLASAAFIYWFSHVETYTFASLSISFVLYLCAREARTPLPVWTLASAATLAITTTNWFAALAGSFFSLPFRKFISCTLLALALVSCAAALQSRFMPHADFFLNPMKLAGEKRFTQQSRQENGLGEWKPLTNLRHILLSSAVAPEPKTAYFTGDNRPYYAVTNQDSPPARSVTTWLSLASWMTLLCIGLFNGVTRPPVRRLFWTAAAYVAFEALLHVLYGEITFLYALNFFPALVVIASLSLLSGRMRPLALGAAMIFVTTAAISNIDSFNRAAEQASAIATSIAAGGYPPQ